MKKLLFAVAGALLFFACTKDAASEMNPGKSGSITRFAVYHNYMYVLNLNEVQTYDIQDPAHPKLLHRLPTDYGLETIIIYDNTVFLGSNTALYILDIGNPAAPVILSKSERLELLGFTGCDPVVVKGNYAYSTIKSIEDVCGRVGVESALVVYDVTDKSAPVSVGVYTLGLPNGLGYKDNYLFVCDEGYDRLWVFDISDPLMLGLTDYSLSLNDPIDLIVDGQRMIVSSKTDFQIFDISDVSKIRKVGSISK